ncbi:MAG: DUF362 domain-containing protein [Chloroflexi bacterium]|nr:DUF362 domain-containing protein [Chloroflexota bacterium]
MQTPKPKVAVIYTAPQTVLSDIGSVMELAGYRAALPPDVPTLLKINISWQRYYPACSTTPWQLEGVIQTLRQGGYREIIPAQNGTVVVNSYEGELKNKHLAALEKCGLKSVHLGDPGVEWVKYEPQGKMLVLDKVFPKGIRIPALFKGKNIVHLPTMKTHVFTTMTGAMKNAFGGLLNERRHWTHSVIHETLVDLLTIQREIHPGIFAVMDGTFAGDGPGPRAMRPLLKNTLLASADPVAIDAVAAKIMGFDPMSLAFLRLAHEGGLGCADLSQIEIVGEDISRVNWRFQGAEETLASRGQKLIYHGALQPLEHLLLRTFIAPWSYAASRLYFDFFWYPFVGRGRVQEAMKTGWGKLFQSY